jgi:serine/threonine protein phosphatase PrpC
LDTEIRQKQNKRNDTVLMLTEKMERSIVSSRHDRVKFERSGSTCVVVMVTPSHIICANAGDSRAVLRRNGKTLPLSFDHKPNNIPEHERIVSSGGFVKSKRVDGDLAVSRGLGDFTYKSNESKTVENQKVIPDPEFVVYPRSLEQDEFMILACDGVWDVATNDQCSDFAQELLGDGESDLGLICEEAIDNCLEKNSRDNMAISMVTFDAAKIARGLQVRNAVWQRRLRFRPKMWHPERRPTWDFLGIVVLVQLQSRLRPEEANEPRLPSEQGNKETMRYTTHRKTTQVHNKNWIVSQLSFLAA